MKNKIKVITWFALIIFLGISLFCNLKLWSDCISWRSWGKAANEEVIRLTEELNTCNSEKNVLVTEVENLKEEKAGLENQIAELNKTITNLKK